MSGNAKPTENVLWDNIKGDFYHDSSYIILIVAYCEFLSFWELILTTRDLEKGQLKVLWLTVWARPWQGGATKS